MKFIRVTAFLFAMILGMATAASASESKILIVYYSWSGNTRHIASLIKEKAGGDLVEIEMVKPYSRTYNTCLEESLKDLRAGTRPALRTKIQDIKQYDIIFLGYPTWWGTIPMPVASLLEQYDFSGKTIIPFNSHGGGHFGQTVPAIAKLCPTSTIKPILSVSYGGGVGLSREIDAWLSRVGMSK